MVTISYIIDANDEIISVNDSWDQFAKANHGSELAFAGLKRKRIWDHISDLSTIQFYHDLITRVRSGKMIEIPLRCDAPRLRRWLILKVTPLPLGRVSFDARTIREEPRAPAVLLEMSIPRSDTLIRSCGWCRKVDLGEENWVEPEDAITKLSLFDSPTLPKLTHGICPACLQSLCEKLG